MGLYSSILETISFNRNFKNPIVGGMQIWGSWFLIVTPYMIYYIHIIIDYINSSIHMIALPGYIKVILWYIKWYKPINKKQNYDNFICLQIIWDVEANIYTKQSVNDMWEAW